jgi:hypothetical protein
MSVSDPTVDRGISRAYEMVKKARVDGNYEAIVKWMALVDQLLDERMAQRVPTAAPGSRSVNDRSPAVAG